MVTTTALSPISGKAEIPQQKPVVPPDQVPGEIRDEFARLDRYPFGEYPEDRMLLVLDVREKGYWNQYEAESRRVTGLESANAYLNIGIFGVGLPVLGEVAGAPILKVLTPFVGLPVAFLGAMQLRSGVELKEKKQVVDGAMNTALGVAMTASPFVPAATWASLGLYAAKAGYDYWTRVR
ncbi:MAG: hypothetical protein HYU64_10960 [Armatimonadetes bacterium]|nr:hypothetical protein [Armatimonadota bacterium]